MRCEDDLSVVEKILIETENGSGGMTSSCQPLYEEGSTIFWRRTIQALSEELRIANKLSRQTEDQLIGEIRSKSMELWQSEPTLTVSFRKFSLAAVAIIMLTLFGATAGIVRRYNFTPASNSAVKISRDIMTPSKLNQRFIEIMSAQPGDTVVLTEGILDRSLRIDKPLRIVVGTSHTTNIR